MLRFMGLQRVRHNCVTELNRTELNEDPQDVLELTLKRGVLFIKNRSVKVRSQKIPGVTGKS